MSAPTDAPTISVVIPAFNAERYLGAAIESILGQTHPVTEIIVVDDASTDDTAAVAESFGDRVRLLRQEKLGANAARTLGVQASSGTFLAFHDADDLWEPTKTQVQLDAFRSEPEPDIVFGLVTQFRSPELGADEVFVPDGADRPMVAHHSGAMLLRREIFDAIGPLDPTIRFGQFVDWFARAIDQGRRIVVVDEVVMRRRLHLENMGRGEDAGPEHDARTLRLVLERRRASRIPLNPI